MNIKISRPVGRPRKEKSTKPIEGIGEYFGLQKSDGQVKQ